MKRRELGCHTHAAASTRPKSLPATQKVEVGVVVVA